MDSALDPEAVATAAWADMQFAVLDRLYDADQRGERRFALPGCELAVQYVGRNVAQVLCHAFEHRSFDANGDTESAPATPASNGTLTWRIADTSIAPAPENCYSPPTVDPFGTIRHDTTNTLLIERRRGWLSVFDVRAATITTLVDGVGAIDTDVAAKPLLRFLMPHLLRHGIVLCHAALVGGERRGLLVTGMGGVGKSTISAAAVAAGVGFCADDFVALEQREDGLVGHSLYASLMLGEHQISRFPRLMPHARHYRRDVFEKMILPLCGTFDRSVRKSLAIDAIAVPHIVPTPASELVTGRRGDVLRALIPTSVFSSPWRESERARALFELVAPLPPLVYRSGADFARIAAPLVDRYGE